MIRRLIILLLIVGCVFADTIVYQTGRYKRTIANVVFIKAENGKVYFTKHGIESSRNCSQIIELTDDSGNPIDYDCNVVIVEESLIELEKNIEDNAYIYILETNGQTYFKIVDYEFINDEILLTKDGSNWEVYPIMQIKNITDLKGNIIWDNKTSILLKEESHISNFNTYALIIGINLSSIKTNLDVLWSNETPENKLYLNRKVGVNLAIEKKLRSSSLLGLGYLARGVKIEYWEGQHFYENIQDYYYITGYGLHPIYRYKKYFSIFSGIQLGFLFDQTAKEIKRWDNKLIETTNININNEDNKFNGEKVSDTGTPMYDCGLLFVGEIFLSETLNIRLSYFHGLFSQGFDNIIDDNPVGQNLNIGIDINIVHK